MSWPYGSHECPRCRCFEPLDPPARDEAGYDIVGLCTHPRIRTDLFRFKDREVTGGCPCFSERRKAATLSDQPDAGQG